MKKALAIILALIMVFSLAACGTKKEEGKTDEKKIMSVMFGGGTPLYMDPALNSASAGSNVIKLSMCGLMGYQYDAAGKVVVAPELAASYEVSADALTYTFTLRDGLKWSDGQDFTVEDIVKSWNRAASAELGADYGFLYDMFEKNADGSLNVVAKDAKTLECKLAYAAPYFLDLCAFPVFYPVRTDIADAEGVWATKPETSIGMGPFKMVSYTVDDVIVYEKNEYYWNAANVQLDGVQCYLAEENVAILTAYENGTVQLINSIDPTEFARLKSTYGEEFQIADQMGTWYILFNVYKDVSPAGKKLTVQEQSKARQAMGMLWNRVDLVENVTQGGQAPATGFYPAGLSDGLNADVRSSSLYGTWYTGTNTPSTVNAKYTEDQVKGCQMLMDLGYAYTGSLEAGDLKFTDAPTIEFSLNFAGANKYIIEYCQAVFAEFGLNATVNGAAWSTLQQELKAGNAEAARMGWVADYNDCTNFIEIFISASGNNYPRVGQDKGTFQRNSKVTADAGTGAYWGLEGNQTWAEAYDALDKAILVETDAQKRAEMCAQAEQVIMATGAVAPMYFYTNPYMCDDSVSNVIVAVTGDIILTYAQMK